MQIHPLELCLVHHSSVGTRQSTARVQPKSRHVLRLKWYTSLRECIRYPSASYFNPPRAKARTLTLSPTPTNLIGFCDTPCRRRIAGHERWGGGVQGTRKTCECSMVPR